MFNNPFDFEDDATSTVFRDVVFLALSGFIAIVLLIISHINPPAQVNSKDADPPGSMMVEMFWDDQYDLDIDLWVQAPSDNVVGYSSRSGKIFNLLRDDLGFYLDESERNYEIAISRGLKSGEYTVNVMFYSNKQGAQPVPDNGAPMYEDGSSDNSSSATKVKKPLKPLVLPVEVIIIISVRPNDNSKMTKIIKKVVKLYKVKEEITAVNFKLDSNFDLIPESINDIYKKLASSTTNGIQ